MRIARTRLPHYLLVLAVFSLWSCGSRLDEGESVWVGTFNVDATPAIGSPVAYAPARSITDPLSARGIVLLSEDKPIVLCAVDWIGIANGAHDAWREALAEAAGTSPDRVAVHTLHQHDGIRCDFTTDQPDRVAVHRTGDRRAILRPRVRRAGD